MTLLRYLREVERLPGTKEGCAEGDCGACTVVVSEETADGVRHRPVNACICFLGMVEGRVVRTVEGVAGPDGALHPVQAAMVEEHASQCGFCTPGFVMTLYAAHAGGAPMDAAAAVDLLAGNLCRCTGYGPILAAGERAGAAPPPGWDVERRSAERAWLAAAAHAGPVAAGPAGARFYAPNDIGQLRQALAEAPDARIVGGATDVGLWAAKRIRPVDEIIWLGRLDALRRIEQDDTAIRIGATAPYADVAPILAEAFPDFGELLRRLGAEQVRHAGTVGGNIANGSPIGDTPPALIALGATLVLLGPDGERTLPLEDFFIAYGAQDLRPGEIVARIDAPRLPAGAQFACYKVSKRFDQDISALCGGFNVTVADGVVRAARIAFGGMAATPKRAAAVEAALVGAPWREATIEAAAAAFEGDFAPIDDMRASAAYRLAAARNLLVRFFRESAGPLAATRLVGRGAAETSRLPSGFQLAPAPLTADLNGGVGVARAHDSGAKHVSGTAAYVDDLPTPMGALTAHIAMSERAHARVTSLDLAAVRAAPGVVAVLAADDIPGKNDVSPAAGDDPMFATGLVAYVGQSLFAVVAETEAAARAAADLARVDYEDLPAILSIDQAMDAESWLEPPYQMARGDAEAAIEAAPHRLSGRIYIGGQEHFYLEGQAALVLPGEDGDVHVHCSSQHPSEIQHTVAKVLGRSNNAVTVEVRRMGGAFGGKESQGNLPAAVAALAAVKTGRAVKARYDRDQDMIITGKRHDFRIDYRVGFDATGRILGVAFEQAARCGMSFDLSMPICDRAMFHADNAYYLENARIVSYRCKTHTVSNTAFRGFGGPQGMVGIERVVDEIAHALGLDPADVRRRNFYDPPGEGGARSITPYHMTVEDCVIDEIATDLRQSADYDRRRAEIRAWNATSPVLKRGIALTPVKFGISFTLTHLNQAGALVHVYNDGSIHLNHGGTEMGQGLFTKVAQVAAEAFQVDLDRIKITASHTGKVPNTSATAASSGSDMNGMAVADACRQIKARLIDFAARRWQAAPEEIVFLPDRVRVGGREIAFDDLAAEAYRARISLSAAGFYATPRVHWDRDAAKGRPFYYFAYGAAVSEAVIDTLTGENRLLRVDILHDVGKSLNPALDLGQIEGGFVQGAGWLTTEELYWDAAGRLRTHAPSTYKIPTAGDRAPDMRIGIWPGGQNREETIYRSKAVGEPPLMLGISAFLALSDAVAAAGDYSAYPALDAPATPECVLKAVQRVQRARGAAA